MKEPRTANRSDQAAQLSLVPAAVLLDQGHQIHDAIARRAYELFESRGATDGNDIGDWIQAESELLHTCRHDLKETAEAIIFHTELPCAFTGEQLKVSVEPRRVTLSGEREVSAIFADPTGTHTGPLVRRVFRVHDLPVEVDASRAVATLKAERIVSIVMPKVSASNKKADEAKAAGGKPWCESNGYPQSV